MQQIMFSRSACTVAFVTGLSLAISVSAYANEPKTGWTSFRNGGGSMVASQLPKSWSAETGVLWQDELIGYGQSAPVIYDGRVYVCSVEGPMSEQVVVQCFDLNNGKQLWKFEHSASVQHPSNYMNARAAPTPIVDERGLYAFFETGDFVALGHDGQLMWHRNEAESFGKFENNHGIGSSPAADDDHLYLLVEHDGPSSLAAISKATGETVWSTKRDSTKSWASPIVANVNGTSQVIVSSGGTVAGYDSADGSQLWTVDGIEGNNVPSPVVSGNYLVVAARLPEFASDGQVKANCCLDLSNVVDGQPSILWRADKAIAEYASPVVCGNMVYFLNKASVLHAIDVESGDIAYRKRLELDCWASPIVAEDMVYFFGKNGETKVIRSGSSFEEVASSTLWNLDEPPKPVSYVEYNGDGGGHGGAHGGSPVGHGGEGQHGSHGSSGHPGAKSESGEGGRRPGGGMMARMMEGDANKDGVLEGDEIPGMFRGMLARIDTNGDKKLDSEELEAMAKSFAERRKNASSSARDPIVYGVAAADGKIVIRTGTRLYVVGAR